MTTILTLALDDVSQGHFERLRQAYYPEALNRIRAHLTLFHSLPATEEARTLIAREATAMTAFTIHVDAVKSIGKGVAYFLESPELMEVHRRLAHQFEHNLSAQDRQGFRPHIVVQNKVTAAEARRLHAQLSANFVPWDVQADGMSWWNYLGGPWEHRETFSFS